MDRGLDRDGTLRKLDAEVLTIGDELNRGEIVDTNSSFLAERLTALGLHVRWRSSVTDDRPDLIEAIEQASRRADVVVCSGGLGPTDDDRTVDVVAGLLGVEPVQEPEHEARMVRRFAERGFQLTPNNLRQVRIPAGAEVLKNPTGMAPGFTVSLGRARLSFMPGVPREMKPMFEEGLARSLAERVGDALKTHRRSFRLAGVGESHVDHALRDLLDGVDQSAGAVTLHFRIAFPENIVTLVVRRATDEAAAAELARLSAEVQRRLAEHLYGDGQETLPAAVGRRLRERGEWLSLAESCTGGLVGALITDVAGSSAYFKGGIVAYDNAVKIAQLGVDVQVLEREGAVSEAVAVQMAEGVRARLGTTWAIALTGVAGPAGGTEEKPVGTVWIAIAGPAGTRAKKLFWPGDREQVRRISAITALHLLYKALR